MGGALRFYGAITTILGILAPAGILLTLGVFTTLAFQRGRDALRTRFNGHARELLAWATGVALGATLGSLYFSDVVGFVPCSLCWYQRIAMYPLWVVLGVAVWRNEPGVWVYALPLSLIGFVISAYHVMVQYRPSLEIAACTGGVPCSARYILVYGFVSIPVMAGSAFLFVAACLLMVRLVQPSDGRT